jgi:hypothetical protein
MSNVILCPHCGRSVRVGEVPAGRKVRCPLCSEVFAPHAATASAPVPAAERPPKPAAPRPAKPSSSHKPTADDDVDVFDDVETENPKPARKAAPARAARGRPAEDADEPDDRPTPRSGWGMTRFALCVCAAAAGLFILGRLAGLGLMLLDEAGFRSGPAAVFGWGRWAPVAVIPAAFVFLVSLCLLLVSPNKHGARTRSFAALALAGLAALFYPLVLPLEAVLFKNLPSWGTWLVAGYMLVVLCLGFAGWFTHVSALSALARTARDNRLANSFGRLFLFAGIAIGGYVAVEVVIQLVVSVVLSAGMTGAWFYNILWGINVLIRFTKVAAEIGLAGWYLALMLRAFSATRE